jgi:DNA-binding PadR family transcriptional regulator
MAMTDPLRCSAYVVLGLIARHGPMTPYELKARAEESTGFFWPIPHAQLYRDPQKLAELGLLREEAEEHGRRRRVFHLTGAGRAALDCWLADPPTARPEHRDPSLIKLVFADLGPAGDRAALVRTQADQHRYWLDRYLTRRAGLSPADISRRRLVDLGIRYEQAYLNFWESLARDDDRTGHGS